MSRLSAVDLLPLRDAIMPGVPICRPRLALAILAVRGVRVVGRRGVHRTNRKHVSINTRDLIM